MQIASVVSFQGAWEQIQDAHENELSEVISGLVNYLDDNVKFSDESGNRYPREVFEKAMYDQGWILNETTFYSQSGRRMPIRSVGPIKNGIAVQIAMGGPDILSRWLFTHTTLATRHGIAAIPILLVPMESELDDQSRVRPLRRFTTFERFAEQIEMLAPLSLGYPFLIVGYSRQNSLLETNVIEIAQDENAKSEQESSIIDRSIEFPPEYHQAGIGILNYFATYLNEQCPAENATVRIEQSGLKVRMIVQSDGGNEEVIEKALHEYQMIVSGEERADKFTDNEKLILELRNELRVAKFRLESQQDIISLQNLSAQKSEERITGLLNILGKGLQSRDKNEIHVEVNPCIQTSVAVEFNQDISFAIGSVGELSECIPSNDESQLQLKDLEQSLSSIEDEKDPETVRRSSAMSKFRRIIEQMSDGNSKLGNALELAEQGYDVAKSLAKSYNKIASWCGLPNVPELFVK